MTVTSPTISFGRNAIAIKDGATFSCPDLQSFADLTDLKNGTTKTLPYATFEENFWLLDSNYHFKPSTAVHVGMMSGTMTDAFGNFVVPPVLTVTFSAVHSSTGMTLRFSQSTDDYCTDVALRFYDASNVLITTYSLAPDAPVYSFNVSVSNFKKITLTFTSTNKPYRYARLSGIDFDTLTTFAGAEIQSARLVEQINPLSVELPVNTLDFSLFSSDGDFSVTDPQGVYANLQYKEPLDVHESIDGATLYLGRFYLDTWESKSENLADFKSSDAIGLMDGVDYLPEGTSSHHVDPINYYAGSSSAVLSEDLIADIMLQAGLGYSLDASLTGITISPSTLDNKTWLSVTSCRECLQLVLFRIGAYATCARSNIVVIKPLVMASGLVAYDYTLTAEDKGLGLPVQLRPLVTGVEITSHDYSYDSTAAEWILKLYPIAAGTHIVKFKKPYTNFTYSFTPPGSVTQVSYGSSWAEYAVSVQANLQIGGFPWIDTPSLTGVYLSPSIGSDNIIKIDATIVNKENAATVAQRIYDYYLQRYLQKTKLFASQIVVGNSVLIDTQSSKQIKGIVERMETDLANGFVSQTEIVGVVI